MSNFLTVSLGKDQNFRSITLNTAHIISIDFSAKNYVVKTVNGDVFVGSISAPDADLSGLLQEQQIIPAAAGFVRIVVSADAKDKALYINGDVVLGWAVRGGVTTGPRPVTWEGVSDVGGIAEDDTSAIVCPDGSVLGYDGCHHTNLDEFLACEHARPVSEGYELHYFGAAPRPKTAEAKAAAYAPVADAKETSRKTRHTDPVHI